MTEVLNNRVDKTERRCCQSLLTEHPGTTMIRVEYEYMIFRTAVNHFSTTSFNCSFIPQQNRKKVVDGNIIPNIILFLLKISIAERDALQYTNKRDLEMNLWDSLVDIVTMGTIDDHSWPWVFFIVCNIVIHKNDNVFIFQTASFQGLICMADISLQKKYDMLM